MTSLEADIAEDLQEKDGVTADDEHQLQVQAYAVPDDAAPILSFERFSTCTFNQLKTVLRRNHDAIGSATADSLITELEGEVY